MVRRSVALACLLVPLGGGASAGAPSCRTISVAPGETTLQAAVGAARPCDWILVAPGVYHGAVTIATPDVHLRGLDRNRVVLDGGGQAGNGITVEADGVSVENLTVRNFDRRSVNDDDTGNEVRWLHVHGYAGRYLTAYDTGLHGGYGLWASRSQDGVLDHVYASGFSDSGLYVGACRDCDALVEHATAERDLIGLAATNASGHVVVESSLFADNTVGASFNSSLSDPPPPQRGTCGPPTAIATTRLERCTVFRDNRVVGNNALDVPSETSAVRPGAGIGVELLGAEGDLVARNVVEDNANVGVLGLPLPETGPARFPLAGDRISGNRITGSRLAVALAGGAGSVDDCAEANGDGAEVGTYSCAPAATPSPPGAATRRVDALVARLGAELAAAPRRAQPAPPPQPTMPTPCAGVPPTPLCR
jgi:hypothetical protein